jgi:hypothetical protein
MIVATTHLFSFWLPVAALALSTLLVALRNRPQGRDISRLWNRYRRLASHQTAACVGVGALTVAIRLSLLPVWPKPIPSVYDEFSYLLMADTFGLGRLTNPSPPHWQHFETLFVQLTPTYQSAYPPAQGLFLAAGKVLLGHPWWGVLVSMGVLAAALCWMAQAWLPPPWALLAALLGVFQFSVNSYWMNSYWGGAPSAMGGAILLGCWPRLARKPSRVVAAGLGAALLLLANSRPWEGLLLALAVLPMLVYDLRASSAANWWRILWPAGLVLICGATWMAWYFWRVTGSPLRMPYQVAFEQYASGGIFFWQAPRQISYRHAELEQFYKGMAAYGQAQYDGPLGFLRISWEKVYVIAQFYIGSLVFALLAALPLLIRNRRMARLLICLAAVGLGNLATTFLQIHYAAPLAGVFVILSCCSLRVFWLLQKRGWTIGGYLVPALCILMVASFAASLPYAVRQPEPLIRVRIANELNASPDKHLVFVRYGANHILVADEWIYNDANLSGAKVIWARDMGSEENRHILEDYPGRRVWLIEPDLNPLKLLSYK